MITVFSSDDKRFCELLAEHLQVITMVKEIGKIQVVPRDETQKYGYHGKFWIVLDDRCKQYSTTMESVYNAVTDFEAGYKAAKKENEKREK